PPLAVDRDHDEDRCRHIRVPLCADPFADSAIRGDIHSYRPLTLPESIDQMPPAQRELDLRSARRLWLHAQRLDSRNPFGDGADATRRAVEHLGYVQIDTISVVERSHHHILF